MPLIDAPNLPYLPRNPRSYNPGIALVACGGITGFHLKAYREAGYRVVALCDINRDAAEARQREFFPDAAVYTDHRQVLKRDDVEVVDLAAHPAVRVPMIRAALGAGKHVLSQKPFVLDINTGQKLADLADRKNLRLAVNQNARWAPHFAWMRQAVADGHIGHVFSAHLSAHWNHNWIRGTAFERIRHVILYDFAIHWFDLLTTLLPGRQARRVYASFTRSPGQEAEPALLAQVLIEYDDAQSTLVFDGDTRVGSEYRSYLVGTGGTLEGRGMDIQRQELTLHTPAGHAQPKLEGGWFTNGFHGTMAELLCAIEENREPENSARNNLASLGLCFAAIASAETHRPTIPWPAPGRRTPVRLPGVASSRTGC